MNLKQLEAFVGVAESRSFSRTARRLYLTQPTISAHISSLEKELNAKLIIRNTKEVHLSAAGEKLYNYAKQMVDLQQEVLREFQVSVQNEPKVLSIAASTIPSQYILPSLMQRFTGENQLDSYSLTESDSAGVVDMVANRKVDIGLTGAIIKRPHCEFIPFYKDRLVIIAPNTPAYQAIPKDGFTVKMLREASLIMREEGSGTRLEMEKHLARLGIDISELPSVASVSNQETIKKMVAGGMGISIISALAAEDYLSEGKLLSFDMGSGGAVRNLYAVYNKDHALSPLAEKFVEFVSRG